MDCVFQIHKTPPERGTEWKKMNKSKLGKAKRVRNRRIVLILCGMLLRIVTVFVLLNETSWYFLSMRTKLSKLIRL